MKRVVFDQPIVPEVMAKGIRSAFFEINATDFRYWGVAEIEAFGFLNGRSGCQSDCEFRLTWHNYPSFDGSHPALLPQRLNVPGPKVSDVGMIVKNCHRCIGNRVRPIFIAA